MSIPPRKLTFQEAIDSCTCFFTDDELEQRFDDFIAQRLQEEFPPTTEGELTKFLQSKPRALLTVLEQMYLSQEKFRRIVTLMRRLKGSFDRDWDINRIETQLKKNDAFASTIAKLLLSGNTDPSLASYLPKVYREKLCLRELARPATATVLKLRMKEKHIGTFTNWAGDRIEELVKEQLEKVKTTYGIPYTSGTTPLLNVTVNWAVPNLEDPHVIIMCSYMETTSSDQSTKARDMVDCYQKIEDRNLRHLEKRAFINFVEGAGWLARLKDFHRLVTGCHYFLNIKNLPMLEGIILQHVPRRYFKSQII